MANFSNCPECTNRVRRRRSDNRICWHRGGYGRKWCFASASGAEGRKQLPRGAKPKPGSKAEAIAAIDSLPVVQLPPPGDA